ncbi:muscleblind-like protein 1 isoform X2 [Lingula anatina]|uniref:Muscleblind-like protein 1 isoform X2 n=1 Tax=Lingula anatina TaxID=7574 RepID=A0A1S3J921_LINAN|nr:muscleblind-like protein 1 isoform X2 [Lingula anatina]|eukprot:XP_013406895.1 muscleblind-like protein 1 isoform X2 [Lingula anatina]
MAMVNPAAGIPNSAVMNPMAAAQLATLANQKDSRWLTLEVCREYQRNKCTRTELECKFAHPPPHVEVQNGRVTCCFDSIKGKCQRKEPPCKYLHPPQHLREQLLQNGRNNLIMKNLQMQMLTQQAGYQVMPMQAPRVNPMTARTQAEGVWPYTSYCDIESTSPLEEAYLRSKNPASNFYTAPQYIGGVPPAFQYATSLPGIPAAAGLISSTDGNQMMQSMALASTAQLPGGVPTTVAAQSKLQRADRLEVCREFQRGACSREHDECRYAHPPDSVHIDPNDNHVTVCMDYIKGKCSRDSCRYFHPPPHLQAQIKAIQQRANAAAAAATAQAQAMGMVPGMPQYIKRPAVADKNGLPVYQPTTATAYQQALSMQLQHQQGYMPVAFTGHPASVQRF